MRKISCLVYLLLSMLSKDFIKCVSLLLRAMEYVCDLFVLLFVFNFISIEHDLYILPVKRCIRSFLSIQVSCPHCERCQGHQPKALCELEV